MKRKAKISQSEKIRREKQRQGQWEKDNQNIVYAIKNFYPPKLEEFRAGILAYPL